MHWNDIPLFPRSCYEIDIGWQYLERHLETEMKQGLDLDPDFQRLHVWSDEQRVRYLEYVLRGGEVGRNLTAACTSWHSSPTPNYVLVDGKQRLETVRRFMRNELAVFGHRFSEIEGHFRMIQSTFKWRVVECATHADTLQLYLNINAGGTPHTDDEIEKVRAMVKALSVPK